MLVYGKIPEMAVIAVMALVAEMAKKVLVVSINWNDWKYYSLKRG